MIQISRKVLPRIAKHGLNVYPLEAFGLLLGSISENCIDVALPSGRTEHWYNPNERYGNLKRAIKFGKNFAQNNKLDLLGIYHTGSGGHPDFKSSEASPITTAPEYLRNMLVLIRPLDGGEAIWGSTLYFWKDCWKPTEFKQIKHRNHSQELNPKRLYSAWISEFGSIDYGNNAEKEMPRLFET